MGEDISGTPSGEFSELTCQSSQLGNTEKYTPNSLGNTLCEKGYITPLFLSNPLLDDLNVGYFITQDPKLTKFL